MKNGFFYFNWLFLIFLIFQHLSAHPQEQNAFVGIRSGVSIPFSGYHSTVLDEGSFTQTGFNASLEGVWYFARHLGVGLNAGLNLHPVDVSSLGRAQVNNEPFLNNVVIRSEPYKIITLMSGAYGRFQISEKWTASGNFSVGLLHGKTPYQLYKPDYYLLPNNWEEITSATNYKLSWQAGVALNYGISQCIGISLNSNVMYDKLHFTFQTAQGSRVDEREIAIINIMLGLNIIL